MKETKILHCYTVNYYRKDPRIEYAEVEVTETEKTYRSTERMGFPNYNTVVAKDTVGRVTDGYGVCIILEQRDDEHARQLLCEYYETRAESYTAAATRETIHAHLMKSCEIREETK